MSRPARALPRAASATRGRQLLGVGRGRRSALVALERLARDQPRCDADEAARGRPDRPADRRPDRRARGHPEARLDGLEAAILDWPPGNEPRLVRGVERLGELAILRLHHGRLLSGHITARAGAVARVPDSPRVATNGGAWGRAVR